MDQMLHVSSNPHVRDKMTTSKIMQLVVLALLPTTLFGIYNFGLRALLVVVITVASSVFFEWIYDKLMHKKNTITDFSAVVTGLLLALNMPASIPLWMPVLGSAFAIIVVKQLFGGLGQNFMNPALAGRCFLMISFAGKMTDFAVSDSFRGVVDTVSGATPLAALKQNGFTECIAARRAVEDYRLQSDSLRQFLNDERYKSDVNVKTKIVDLYIEYKYYCQENGFYHLTKPNFIKRLKSYGIQVATINVGNVAYLKKHKSDEE